MSNTGFPILAGKGYSIESWLSDHDSKLKVTTLEFKKEGKIQLKREHSYSIPTSASFSTHSYQKVQLANMKYPFNTEALE